MRRPARRHRRLLCVMSVMVLPTLAACGGGALPTSPSAMGRSVPASVFLQAEPGSGEGRVLARSHAIGGQTLHLAPGERRTWTFSTRSVEARHRVAVSYSNSRWGDREILDVEIDGVSVATFEAVETGEDEEGWNEFAVHPAGAVTLRAGTHTLVVQSSGGDGCVEVDFVEVNPAES